MAHRLSPLWLGVEQALASRTARLRTALTAGGVALGVVVLALAASVPHAYSAREARAQGSNPEFGGHGRLRLLDFFTIFDGVTIGENAVQVTGSAADGPVPRPPGVARLPAPGEMVVSPRVAALLHGPGGAQLRRRLRAGVVGTIGRAGLTGPDDAVLYRGSSALVALGEPAVQRFGASPGEERTPTIVTLLIIVIVVALLLPVGAFVAAAARFGAEERDRRLAALRLVGADRSTAAGVAAGEALLGAAVGIGIGAVGFLLARPLAASLGTGSAQVFVSDLHPSVAFAVLVIVLVAVSAVGAALVSIRRVAVEPLGVSRRGVDRRRRLGWRLVAPLLGFLLLAPLLGSADRLAGAGGQAEATLGVMLVLVGVTALLPWVVEAVVRRAGDGPLPWLLAVRRLRVQEGSTGRVVGAIGLAVAGAIALSIVFGAAGFHERDRVTGLEARTFAVQLTASSRSAAARDLAALREIPGVQRATGTVGDGRGNGLAGLAATVVLRPVGEVDRGVSAGGAGARDRAIASAAERVSDRAAAMDPLAQVESNGYPEAESRQFSDLRRALVVGAIVVLAMIGASLLVTAGEGLRERRRSLAVLAAFGTRRATVAWSVLWQTAIPVLGGLVLALVLGISLGAMLCAIVGLVPDVDWGTIGLMVATGAAVIAAVTALTLPTLARMMRPEALRVE